MSRSPKSIYKIQTE